MTLPRAEAPPDGSERGEAQFDECRQQVRVGEDDQRDARLGRNERDERRDQKILMYDGVQPRLIGLKLRKRMVLTISAAGTSTIAQTPASER